MTAAAVPLILLLLLYLLTLLFAVKQLRWPYRFLNWELAWGFKTGACLVLIARRVFLWYVTDWPPSTEDVLEMWLSLPFAVLFFAANLFHARIYSIPITIREFPPAIIRINAASRVLTWDASAQVLFGYSPLEALGKDLAELIIPPALQEEHRAGLRRFAAGEQSSRIVGRTISITARHKDGTEFPVEIHVDAVTAPGGTEFVGRVRKLVRL